MKPIPRKVQKLFWAAILSLLLLAAQHFGLVNSLAEKPKNAPLGFYNVTQFYDGDTIAVNMNGQEEKIRMIGVDTPETHDPRKAVQCFGRAASDFTKQLIGSNAVRLEADPENTNRDRYDRLLRYVYLPDGRLVNAEIIFGGYGFAYTSFPFTKLDEFKTIEKQAKDANRGLWANCEPTINSQGYINSNDE